MPYHLMMRYARDERLALCALLDQAGPREPTLCQGWATVDLAAHLVLRERRPDAGVGLLGGPLAAYTRSVQRKLAERTPFPRLVEMIRTGPPRYSLFALPGADERANLAEYFVHHEDVRRAQPDWEPRKLDPGLTEALWHRLGMARFILRNAPVGVELARDDLPEPTSPGGGAGGSAPGRTGGGPGPGTHRVRITAKARTPVVTVTGPPGELTMWAFGRTAAARVRLDGSKAAVEALTAARWQV